MGINIKHLREYVIRPTLYKLDLWSKSAENLLIGTIAQESQGGYFNLSDRIFAKNYLCIGGNGKVFAG